MPASATTTILFTDLVGSTDLLQRAGDERAQKIFQAHYRLLRDVVAANGGQEVKTLGDGLMVAFPSAADGVRSAVTMQQASRRRSLGERLEIRVGLNTGDAMSDEGDFFGSCVVIARRLCDSARSGQILCSAIVAALLAGRQAFAFLDLGSMVLKGIAQPVAVCEVKYARDDATVILARAPFVGRGAEISRLQDKLSDARGGHGGLVMLVGEPGIGKTRMAEEFCETARSEGATVLWGRCFDGDHQPPYAPFAQAVAGYARIAEPDALRADLGNGAGPIGRLVPELRQRLPDIPEPVALQPDEERIRLLDAVSQFVTATSIRAPIVLVLEDLHWADKGTLAMLRHVARFTTRSRVLLLGSYRDVEVDREHPLADALAALRREAEYDRVLLKGLQNREVGELLAALADHDVDQTLVDAISAETDGNPFFIREVLIHLIEEGKIHRDGERWRGSVTVAEMSIPEGVRQVIGRRLSRLSEPANRLLSAAAAFNGVFRFDVAAAVAGQTETAALDAVDEALQAQVLHPGPQTDTYDFTHALIRHTLYSEMSPSRRVRLHRQIAEALQKAYGASHETAAEIAYQYHLSALLPGSERGVPFAIAAADQAEAVYAWDNAVKFIKMAQALMAGDDPRRPRVLARLGPALAWTLEFEAAQNTALEAGRLVDDVEGAGAAAALLADTASTLVAAGARRAAWALAGQGLNYVGDQRDVTWARLMRLELERLDEADTINPGLSRGTSERVEALEAMRRILGDAIAPLTSRNEAVARVAAMPESHFAAPMLVDFVGDFSRAATLAEQGARLLETQGRIANASTFWATAARSYCALGEFAQAREPYRRSRDLQARLPPGSGNPVSINARDEMRIALDQDWRAALAAVEPLLSQRLSVIYGSFAAVLAAAARIYARVGRTEESLHSIETLLPALEQLTAWSGNIGVRAACDAVWTLWWLARTDHIDIIERAVLERVVEPDFRQPFMDGRLSMARLCALQGRYDEAVDWFAKAREVLDEQGARPLRAIADFDEGWMYVRRAAPGDPQRARPLLEVALSQFRDIGMTGWIRRAEEMLAGLS